MDEEAKGNFISNQPQGGGMNMDFEKYQHIERFNTTEVEGIDIGEVYVFPKIDGTNASLWIDEGELKAGSRNRELSIDNDNAGFYEWALKQSSIIEFFEAYPNHRLYGEWLVPHSLKTYRDSSWRDFYVFDVVDAMNGKYLPYNEYKIIMDKFSINYIPPIIVLKNPPEDRIILQLERNNYLIEDGKGTGEGIVLKNYDFVNKHGRQIWAKIVTSEFKEKAHKIMGHPISTYNESIESQIADKYITKALCDKVYSKIDNETGFTSRDIPRLLNTVYYDLIREESWSIIKEFKDPVINYKKLKHVTFDKTKKILPNLF